jgi:hypothetical protein
MRKSIAMVGILVVLVGVVSVSAATLMTRPAPGPGGGGGPDTQGFYPCPWPPCMAPCVYPAPPEVLCKAPDGSVTRTTFACCCCGGSGNSYKFRR